MTNRIKLAHDLAVILSKPEYGGMLQRRNADLEMQHGYGERRAALKNPALEPSAYKARTAMELAERAVKDAIGRPDAPKLMDKTTYVTELVAKDSEIYLYRLYDGISHKTALTLGSWWCRRSLLEQIFAATSGSTGVNRRGRVLELLRTAMFIYPRWNLGTNIARMAIPQGARAPAIAGLGSWEAMKSNRPEPLKLTQGQPILGVLGSSRAPGSLGKGALPSVALHTSTLEIRTPGDVIDKLGMMPIPGFEQLFLPLFNDMWVTGVPDLSPDWPFGP